MAFDKMRTTFYFKGARYFLARRLCSPVPFYDIDRFEKRA